MLITNITIKIMIISVIVIVIVIIIILDTSRLVPGRLSATNNPRILEAAGLNRDK